MSLGYEHDVAILQLRILRCIAVHHLSDVVRRLRVTADDLDLAQIGPRRGAAGGVQCA